MRIKEELFNIPGSMPRGENPLPAFRKREAERVSSQEGFPEELKATLGFMPKVLPYLVQDRYDRGRDMLSLKSFVLENEYLVARFLPELGGRLHSLYDKRNKCDLLFTNSVIQPGNLANRNAWLSGGIEWNVGNFGHAYTTCDNVFAAVLDDGEGNDFLRIYEFERNKSIFWQVDFHLPDGSPYLITHVRLVNPFSEDTTTYWWSNVAVPTDTNTRVLASGRNVISFVGGSCDFEALPYLGALGGIDATYPARAPKAYDYFIQQNEEGESTWESAVYENGVALFERSTAPLYYKKLFCWGAHRGGDHWQEFLSDGVGTGHYAEIQAGIAPSQLHDKMFAANSKYEWTQCFGGMAVDNSRTHGNEYREAVEYFTEMIDGVLSAEGIAALDSKYTRIADISFGEDRIRHRASGFGALEIKRMKKHADGEPPHTMCFPEDTVGEKERPWLELLENGALPPRDPLASPLSYMVSNKWLPLLKAAREDWQSLLHLGVALYEVHDTTLLASLSYNETEDKEAISAAKAAFERSARLCNNVWAYRNLAVLAERDGEYGVAEAYYDLCMIEYASGEDTAIASEYLTFLLRRKKYEKLWDVYSRLKESFKRNDRISITAAAAAVKLGHMGYLDDFFAREHYDIREGENSLTDIWFEYCALRMAHERGVQLPDRAKLDELIDEAWDLCPPSYDIDFRMTNDKKERYRV